MRRGLLFLFSFLLGCFRLGDRVGESSLTKRSLISEEYRWFEVRTFGTRCREGNDRVLRSSAILRKHYNR